MRGVPPVRRGAESEQESLVPGYGGHRANARARHRQADAVRAAEASDVVAGPQVAEGLRLPDMDGVARYYSRGTAPRCAIRAAVDTGGRCKHPHGEQSCVEQPPHDAQRTPPKRERHASGTSNLGCAPVFRHDPEAYIESVVERFFNGLDVVRGTIGAILLVALAVAAITAGGWQGWLIGFVFLALAAAALIWPWKRPRYRPPRS